MKTPRAVPSLVAAVALLAAVPACATAAPLGFAKPYFVSTTLPGGEPVLIADPVHHTVVYSSHAGTTHIYKPGLASTGTLQFAAGYRNQVQMFISHDDGKSFTPIDYAGGAPTDPTKNQGFSDPDLTQDEGGRLYNTGIDLANDALFSSADGGMTWDSGTIECTPGDRPWLAGGKKNEVFMSTDAEDPTAPSHEVFQSTDGGNTCSTKGIAAAGTSPTDGDWTGDGKLYYDRATDQLFEPAVYAGGAGGVGIDVWKRGDAAFTEHKVPVTTNLYAHWPSVAQDDGGTIYIVWDTNPTTAGSSGGCNGDPTPLPNKVLMAATHDFGKTWSTPIVVGEPSNARAFWPWVVAGEAGKVNVVWYQTDKLVDIACQNASLSIESTTITNADQFGQEQAYGPIDAAGRPIATDTNICQSGTTCVATGEDRRLGDFLTQNVMLDGCVAIGSGDTTMVDPVTGGQLPTSRPIFIKQDSGPRLRGAGDCSGSAPAQATQDLGLPPSSRTCTSRRSFTIRLRAPHGVHLRSGTVRVGTKSVRAHRRGSRLVATVNLTGSAKGRYTISIRAVTTKGRVLRSTRTYRTCTKRGTP